MLKNRSSKKTNELDKEEFQRRVQTLGESDLLEAMETTLNSLCRHVIDYRRERLEVYIPEILMNADAISGMAAEMARRKGQQPIVPIAPARQVRPKKQRFR